MDSDHIRAKRAVKSESHSDEDDLTDDHGNTLELEEGLCHYFPPNVIGEAIWINCR